MLKAAAERGVKVHVIVYKEVAQALTCELNICNIGGLKLVLSSFSKL